MTVKIESLPDTKVLKSEVIEAIIKSLGITKAAFFKKFCSLTTDN